MGPFNVTITVLVQKIVLSLNDYGPVPDPVTAPVTMLSRSSHGAYRATLMYNVQWFLPSRVPATQASSQAESMDYEGSSNDGTNNLDTDRDGARPVRKEEHV